MAIETSPTVAEVRQEILSKFHTAQSHGTALPARGSDDYRGIALLAEAIVARVKRPITLSAMETLTGIIGQELATHGLTRPQKFRNDEVVLAVCAWIAEQLNGGEK